MIEHSRRGSWLRAIAEFAESKSNSLPTFENHTMGGARTRTTTDGRFITFRRRFVSADQAAIDGIEWTLWREANDSPEAVAAFRESAEPHEERVAATFALLQGWLLEGWTPAEAKAEVGKHPRAQAIKVSPPFPAKSSEYWLSADKGFGIVVAVDHWRLFARGECLSRWKFDCRCDGASGDRLELELLDRLCMWLVKHWNAIVYGSDFRPEALRGPTTACNAYRKAVLLPELELAPDVAAWWGRHAIRAGDPELPNVFLERQADEIIVSWDNSPTPTRQYRFRSSEEGFDAAIAVPTLRRLINDRLKSAATGSAEPGFVEEGYAAVTAYHADLSPERLAGFGFSEANAYDFAISATSRHPLVGLLRSGQGSDVSLPKFDALWNLLKPSESQSYVKIRDFAKGMDSSFDIREPWESGYRLARAVRNRLSLAGDESIDVERVLRNLDVDVQDLDLGDTGVLGACIAAPGYSPLVVINTVCPDAIGVSGRRVTLAHELCHLLFDRSRLRGLARFERGLADGDRSIEKRANAFAIELLVPMIALKGDDGAIVDEARMGELALRLQVSTHAIRKHAENLRNRMTEG